MIPTGGILNEQNVESATLPSRTWRIDFDSGRVVGMTDGLGAVRQAVAKILQTERFEHLIYDSSYGFEGKGLIGKDPVFVQSELRRRIREALIQDDRIEDVTDFQVDIAGDVATIWFTVVSDHGTFETEVTQNV